jgi:NitT/TauT family transport system substrate-binding protein
VPICGWKSRSGDTIAALIALIVIAVTAAGFGLWHFRGAGNGYQGPKVSISIGAISYDKNALIFIAEARNFFADNGIKVTLKDYDMGSAALEAMMAGKVDLAAASEFVVGRSLNHKGDKFRIIASIAKTQDDYIFSRTDRGINVGDDLKGKRIGLKRQTAAEFYLGRFLDGQGMNIHQVKVDGLAITRL